MQRINQAIFGCFLAGALTFVMVPAGALDAAGSAAPSAGATTTDTETHAATAPVPAGDANSQAQPGSATQTAPTTPATPESKPAGFVVPADFDGPTADIITSAGTITLALDAEHAPATVKNFIHYAQLGRFNNKVVYRVEPGFVVQMGCVDAKGHGCLQAKPVKLESSNGLSNVRGAVAMAHGDKPDSATSEFFINLADHPTLDAVPDLKPNTSGFAVFAHVMKGMDVVDKIAAAKTKGGYGPFPDAAPKKVIHVRAIRIHMPQKKK